MRDFIGPLHWFPLESDRIAGVSLVVDQDPKILTCLLLVISFLVATTDYQRSKHKERKLKQFFLFIFYWTSQANMHSSGKSGCCQTDSEETKRQLFYIKTPKKVDRFQNKCHLTNLSKAFDLTSGGF